MASNPQLDDLTARSDEIIVWLVFGLVFLWLATTLAETVLAKVRPLFPFLIAATLIGVLVAHVVAQL